MKYGRKKYFAALSVAVMLGAAVTLTGCGQKKETKAETETIKVTRETASTEEEIKEDPTVKTKSANGNIQINLPDKTWKSIEEKNDTYVFNSEGNGTLKVVRNTELENIQIPDTEENVLLYLQDIGDDISEMKVVEFKMNDVGTDALRVVKFTVKNELEGMHPYLTSYVILHTDELYDATALAEKTDGKLLAGLKRSVASLQVLHEDHPAKKIVPETTISTEEPERTGNIMTLYDPYGNTIQVYEMSDDTWVDENGHEYYALGAGQWEDDNGAPFLIDAPKDTRETLELVDSEGNVIEIHCQDDGRWVDESDYEYYAEGGGKWSDIGGGEYTVFSEE